MSVYVLATLLLLAVVAGGFLELCRSIEREVTGETTHEDPPG